MIRILYRQNSILLLKMQERRTMKQKYKKLAFFILLLSMLTGCMLLSGCTENKENGSQSSYIVDSDELQDT